MTGDTDSLQREIAELEEALMEATEPHLQQRIALMIASRRHELEARQRAEQP